MGRRRKEPEETKGRRSEHLRNGCGSESGKSERKQTASRISRTGRTVWETRQGERGRSAGAERRERGVGKATGRRNRWRAERKNRKLSIRKCMMKGTKGTGGCMEERGIRGKPGRKAQKKVEAER